jgi:hypothetical protein
MPKVAIDYSKTVIYHFVCQDTNIKCSYIGSTTRFIKRKASHKLECNMETSKHHHLKVYQTIRDNGGWINWEMKPLEEYPCENKTQQMIREQYWIDQLKPEMNCRASYLEGSNKSEKAKAHYEANKDKKKAYYKANIIHIKEIDKANKLKNAVSIKEKKKAFYEANKDKIKKYKNEKFTCECGIIYCQNHKSRHERTQKHLSYVAAKSSSRDHAPANAPA